MSSELLKAQLNCISTEYIHSTFQNLINISLVQEFVQENKFGCFISALLITQFWLNKSYDEKTRSTLAGATDVNSLRMEFRTWGVKACLCDHQHSAGDMDDCT